MKEIYETPEIEVLEFAVEDIIATSDPEEPEEPETGVDEDGIWNW